MRRLALFLMFLVACPSIGFPQSWKDCGEPSTSALCFDVRENQRIRGSLIIPSEAPSTEKTYFLNAEVDSVRYEEGSLARVGSFDGYSLITALSPDAGRPTAIAFFEFSPRRDEFNFLDYTRLNYGLLHYVNGLEHKIVYIYEDLSQHRTSAVNAIPPDELAIIMPTGASGVEIEGSGKTELPARLREVDNVRVFPGSLKNASGEAALKIFYKVPPTPLQSLAGEYLTKFFILFFTPLLGLLMIAPSSSRQAGRRLKFIWTMIVIELLIILGYIYYIYTVTISFDVRSLFDLFLGLGAVGFAAYVAWEKGKTEQQGLATNTDPAAILESEET